MSEDELTDSPLSPSSFPTIAWPILASLAAETELENAGEMNELFVDLDAK
jgi:hypothetical protein